MTSHSVRHSDFVILASFRHLSFVIHPRRAASSGPVIHAGGYHHGKSYPSLIVILDNPSPVPADIETPLKYFKTVRIPSTCCSACA